MLGEWKWYDFYAHVAAVAADVGRCVAVRTGTGASARAGTVVARICYCVIALV